MTNSPLPGFLTKGREEDLLWANSKISFQRCENFTPGIRKRTGPKPDLTYGFKAGENGSKLREFEKMPYFQNFSFEVLGKLLARDPPIQSTVTTGLSRWGSMGSGTRPLYHGSKHSRRLMTPDYLCFPWAVVEVKHAQAQMPDEEFCQCQLANSTACAYEMQENLVASVSDSLPVDPIIGFTCIGPRVKLWLTYRGNDSYVVSIIGIPKHRMRLKSTAYGVHLGNIFGMHLGSPPFGGDHSRDAYLGVTNLEGHDRWLYQ